MVQKLSAVRKTAAWCTLFLLLASLFIPFGTTLAASGNTIFYLDGISASYTDNYGSHTLVGRPTYSNKDRTFGPRASVSVQSDPQLGGFPYGVFGVIETQSGSMPVDPTDLIAAIHGQGVYNIAVSPDMGGRSYDNTLRRLQAAQRNNLRLIIRVMACSDWTQQYECGTNPTINVAKTTAWLGTFKQIFTNYPELQKYVYAWYSFQEPMNNHVSITQMQKAYQTYKAVFPNMPVMTVFSQYQNCKDSNNDGISDCMLGQPQNPYTHGVADIVGLDVYNAVNSAGDYGYYQVKNCYVTARRYVNTIDQRYGTSTPIFGIGQAHALSSAPSNVPEPHQIYREANEWLRAGPDSGLRTVDGLLWYSWHFDSRTSQRYSGMEYHPGVRNMARYIGQQLASGRVTTHTYPYHSRVYIAAFPSSTIRFPRVDHVYLSTGTITLSLSHPWKGDDSRRHVLLDTGGSTTRNRLTIEKTSGNALRFVITDSSGNTKWVSIPVSNYNMPGIPTSPGYSEIAVTWSNGNLALYLDGTTATQRGGSGTGKLSSLGQYVYLGSDITGHYGADAAFGNLTVHSNAFSSTDIVNWTNHKYLAGTLAASTLYSPASGTSTTDTTPTLSWSGNYWASRYQVQVSQSSSFSSMIRSLYITKPSYTVSSALSRGKTYYWRARVSDEYGWSNWSGTQSFKVS